MQSVLIRGGCGYADTSDLIGDIMDIVLIFKIGAIGIAVAVLNQVLSRSGRDEYAMLTTLSGVLVVVMMLIPYLADLFSDLKRLMDF